MAGVTVVARYDEQSAVPFLVENALATTVLDSPATCPQLLNRLTNDSPETVVRVACLHSSSSCRSKLGATENGNN